LTEYASGARADIDLRVTIQSEGMNKELRINQGNFDVFQVVDLSGRERSESKN